jgi:APA family basic amino acid/polyamine antiporter
MRLVAGVWGATLVTLGMAISMAATFVGSSLSGARVAFAASRDGLFFARLAHVNKRFKTPDISLIVQAILATLLLLAIAKFQALFSLSIFAGWLFYALTASTVFVFRKREREKTRSFRMRGYPVVPAVFIAAAAVLVVFSLIDQPRNSLAGALVILLGVPVHYLLERRRSPDLDG